VHAWSRAGRSTTSAGGEFAKSDIARASVRSRKASLTTAPRQVLVRLSVISMQAAMQWRNEFALMHDLSRTLD
jgi:hypothetical protein